MAGRSIFFVKMGDLAQITLVVCQKTTFHSFDALVKIVTNRRYLRKMEHSRCAPVHFQGLSTGLRHVEPVKEN
ncbi:MAG: hypothetical protein ABN490_02525, partial [Pantoea agglomerans]